MGISLSKDKLLEVTGGISAPGSADRDTHKIVFSGVEYSSKEVNGGELFVALPGSSAHGHAFVPEAFARGAALVMVEDKALLGQTPEPERVVVVPSTLAAFQTLATYWRRELDIPVLAITGSVGKTTSKEIAASILLKSGPGCYSLKSHNNHVGVPYSILRISRNHGWAVLEMGMNHPGEIRTLSRIAEPDVVAITQIAPAHVEAFGGIEGIIAAKLEILEGLHQNGTVVLNGDNLELLQAYKRLGPGYRTLLFGYGDGADCSIASVRPLGFEGLDIVLKMGNQEIKAHMNSLGRTTASNAACAALAARALCPDLSSERIREGLESFTAPLMRLNVRYLKDGRRLIDDSYNANPASMRAAIELASDLKRSSSVSVGLILGDMLELGALSEKYHREIGEAIAECRPEYIIAVGPCSNFYLERARASGLEGLSAPSPEEAARLALRRGADIILVKASRGIGLDRAVKILISEVGEELSPPSGDR